MRPVGEVGAWTEKQQRDFLGLPPDRYSRMTWRGWLLLSALTLTACGLSIAAWIWVIRVFSRCAVAG